MNESDRLHLELTNRCTLGCPSCSRTRLIEISKKPLPKNDLDIDDFEKFISCDGGEKIKRFTLAGDYGDPIYYPKLFDFLKRFRSTRTFSIHTNGSFQTEKFWHNLSEILTDEDTIVLAIDGLGEKNSLYRKNSSWDSVMSAIKILQQSKAKLIWQTIVFRFNQYNLEEIKEYAENQGFEFLLLKSHRFDGDENLIPHETNVEVQFLYKKEYDSNKSFIIEPQCLTEKIVTCDGEFLPCDWIRNPYTFYKSQLYKNREKWINRMNIKNINYDQGMEIIKEWADQVHYDGINNPSIVSSLCKMKCRKIT